MRPDRERTSEGEAARTLQETGPTGSGKRRHWLHLWLVLAALWVGAVVYDCLQSWPVFPLDLPRTDPQIRAAYNQAVNAHVGRYVLLGLAPPLLMLGLAWIASRFGRRRV